MRRWLHEKRRTMTATRMRAFHSKLSLLIARTGGSLWLPRKFGPWPVQAQVLCATSPRLRACRNPKNCMRTSTAVVVGCESRRPDSKGSKSVGRTRPRRLISHALTGLRIQGSKSNQKRIWCLTRFQWADWAPGQHDQRLGSRRPSAVQQ